jgi:hypothetical protein
MLTPFRHLRTQTAAARRGRSAVAPRTSALRRIATAGGRSAGVATGDGARPSL